MPSLYNSSFSSFISNTIVNSITGSLLIERLRVRTMLVNVITAQAQALLEFINLVLRQSYCDWAVFKRRNIVHSQISIFRSMFTSKRTNKTTLTNPNNPTIHLPTTYMKIYTFLPIPHIRHFLYTTAFVRPIKSPPKSA